MIVTVTPNPGIDRTVTLSSALTRGAVHRVSSVSSEPGGKGVNVARALSLAGVDAVAVLPAVPGDPFLALLAGAGVPAAPVGVGGAVRTNLAITEPDGTTTKLNEPGAPLDAAALGALTDAVLGRAAGADWVVLSGSLPPGVPDGWYADVVAKLKDRDCRVAVDTSDGPLAALAAGFDTAAPDLIKPNSEELAGLSGRSAHELESAVEQGNPDPVVSAALELIAGVQVFAPDWTDGAWIAGPPPITPRSTVGAGDSSLAGYLRAAVGGADAPDRLRMAVAYGSAAAALPGSALPSPAELDLDGVHVTSIPPDPR